jgi:ribosomal protein S18 acetylase RimI-like enzyme
MTEFSIRPYHSDNRCSLFQIGADTAYFGNPIEAYLDDRQIFLDAFYAYYTDLEPGHSWVACCEDEVVGFLAGCVNTQQYMQNIKRKIFPRVLTNLIRGKYRIGRRSFLYFKGLLSEIVYEDIHPVDLKNFPAHLHINIDFNWRGQGVGRKLIQTYITQLSGLKVTGVHLKTTSQNQIACNLYENMGFKLLYSHPDRFWTRWFGYNVEDRCYGLIIA